MQLLCDAVTLLDCHYEDQYEHDDEEQDRAKDELQTAWRVLLNRWGHLIDEDEIAMAMSDARELPC
jgi:hypothetical protein